MFPEKLGQFISNKGEICVMKKSIVILLIVLLVFSAVMSACKKAAPTAEPTAETAAEVTAEAVSEAVEGDSKIDSAPPYYVVKTWQAMGF